MCLLISCKTNCLTGLDSRIPSSAPPTRYSPERSDYHTGLRKRPLLAPPTVDIVLSISPSRWNEQRQHRWQDGPSRTRKHHVGNPSSPTQQHHSNSLCPLVVELRSLETVCHKAIPSTLLRLPHHRSPSRPQVSTLAINRRRSTLRVRSRQITHTGTGQIQLERRQSGGTKSFAQKQHPRRLRRLPLEIRQLATFSAIYSQHQTHSPSVRNQQRHLPHSVRLLVTRSRDLTRFPLARRNSQPLLPQVSTLDLGSHKLNL